MWDRDSRNYQFKVIQKITNIHDWNSNGYLWKLKSIEIYTLELQTHDSNVNGRLLLFWLTKLCVSQKCKQRMILKQSDKESTRLGIATKWNGISSPPKNIFKAEKLLQLFMQNCTYLRGTHNEYLWSMRISREPVFNLPHRLQLESSFLSLIVSLSVKRKMHGFWHTSFPFNTVNTVEPVVDLRGQRDHHAPPRIKIGHKNRPIQFLHPLIRILQIFSLIF